jgi:serine/threonine protein kinase
MERRDLCGRTLGEFVLLEKIAEGGYGSVYRCEQSLLRRDAVVKVMHERRRFNDAAQERFLREAQLASRLHHPYAAHVYAFGADAQDGLLWIAMEMVHGVTLAHWLETRGPMPLEQFVPFFDCVAQVVQAAHDRGIVHRDLKPSNVMVIEHAGQLIPKLLDFGIAKANPAMVLAEAVPDGSAPTAEVQDVGRVDQGATVRLRAAPAALQRTLTQSEQERSARDHLTRSGAGMGSSAYMSPEQWSNARHVGPATDIYSLGVVAYQALTGGLPFTGESTGECYRQHMYDEVPPLADFSPNLNRAIRRALAKAPEDRHGSVLALASELRDALRASEREQLRTSAQQWADRDREPGLLWGGNALSGLERWTRRAPSGSLSELECSFVAASQRRGRRLRWARWSLVVVLAGLALGALQYRATMRARAAEQVAEATVTQAELEQGRSALLHGEPEATAHLIEAYRHDRSPATAFMLARALQPRLAEQARFASSSGRMWSATFSPDGTRLVTTDDKNAQVWDAQTSRLLVTLHHGDTVYQAVYSQDGTRIITACGDGAVRVWDATSESLVRELRRDATKLRYYLLAVSPDGKFVAAIDVKGDFAHVWDLGTGAPMAEIRNDGLASAALAFSADGRWLATTGGNDVHVADTHTWRQAVTVRGPRINRLAFDPTGSRLVTGAATGDAAIWEIPGGARIQHLRQGLRPKGGGGIRSIDPAIPWPVPARR